MNCYIFSKCNENKLKNCFQSLVLEPHSHKLYKDSFVGHGLWLVIGHLQQSIWLFKLQERWANSSILTVNKSACMTFFFQVDVRLHWSLQVLHQADPKGAIPMNMTHPQCQIERAQRNCYALWVGSSRYEIGWTAPYTPWLTICVLDWSSWSKQNCNANINIQYLTIAYNVV